MILPGKGFTFLDDKFYSVLREFIYQAKAKYNIDILVYNAYRTPEEHDKLKLTNPYAAKEISLHTLGFAVDIIRGNLTKDQLKSIVETAASLGISWGGDFNTPEPWHFYIKPDGDLKKIQEEAEKAWKKFCDEVIKIKHAYMTMFELLTDPFFLYGGYVY